MLDEDRIILSFTYSPRVVAFVKSLSGRRYDPVSRTWSVHLDTAIERLDDLIQQGFPIPDELYVKARRINKLKSDLNALSSAKDAEFQTTLPLYPFQKAIAKFMVMAGNCLNASFVGSGKTITCLAVIDHFQSESNLIVCPKSVLLQWANGEIPRWLPASKVFPVIGNKVERAEIYRSYNQAQGVKFLVLSYETMRIDVDSLLRL